MIEASSSKLLACNNIVVHNTSEDGLLKFGDTVILQHSASRSILSCDPFREIDESKSCTLYPNKFAENCLVTTVANESIPRARNTFIVTRVPSQLSGPLENPRDPKVYVGQNFTLAVHPSMVDNGLPQLFLCSGRSSKSNGRQYSYVGPNADENAIWAVVYPSSGRENILDRKVVAEVEVKITDGFLLKHVATEKYLTCDKYSKVATEFISDPVAKDAGKEFECFVGRSAALDPASSSTNRSKAMKIPSPAAVRGHVPPDPGFQMKHGTSHVIIASDKFSPSLEEYGKAPAVAEYQRASKSLRLSKEDAAAYNWFFLPMTVSSAVADGYAYSVQEKKFVKI